MDPSADDWEFLGRRVAVVSRHVPAQDGIARYAEQLCAALERSGREVVRVGIAGGGGGDVRIEAWGGLKPLRLLAPTRGFDDVLVQYHDSYFLMGGFASRVASYLALGAFARLRRATWVVHEPDEPLPEEVGRSGRAQFRVLELVRRWFWRGAHRAVFHTSAERRSFDERFPAGRRDARLVEHGAHFAPAVDATRAQARERLGLDPDVAVLACVGFLSPHKGVDRVIAAVDEAAPEGLELHVVGQPIAPYPHVLAHVEHLRAVAAQSPRTTLHERYVDDREFDLWIRAADAVVIGYLSAASSGVAARARLLGTPLLTSGAGGLAEQAAEGDLVFDSHDGLVQAIRAVALASSRGRDAAT